MHHFHIGRQILFMRNVNMESSKVRKAEFISLTLLTEMKYIELPVIIIGWNNTNLKLVNI